MVGELLTAEAPPLGGLKARRPFPARLGPNDTLVYKLVTTTDHKTIGIMYLMGRGFARTCGLVIC
jgi:cytochrome c oxidase subunit 1